MTGRSMVILLGVLCVLAASAFTTWRLRPTGRGLDSGDAREIALDHLRSSPHKTRPHLENVDTTRVSVTYRDDLQAYVVDFSWKGAGEIRPGLWAAGYFVVVDERSGEVKEAHAYER